MISEECLTIEWIKKASAQNNSADKILVEKAIRALRLLEGLVDEKVDLKKQFANIVKKKGFTRFELQERGKRSHIDKAHYKFYYFEPVNPFKQRQTAKFNVSSIPAVRTYHPNYLWRNKIDNYFSAILNELKLNI